MLFFGKKKKDDKNIAPLVIGGQTALNPTGSTPVNPAGGTSVPPQSVVTTPVPAPTNNRGLPAQSTPIAPVATPVALPSATGVNIAGVGAPPAQLTPESVSKKVSEVLLPNLQAQPSPIANTLKSITAAPPNKAQKAVESIKPEKKDHRSLMDVFGKKKNEKVATVAAVLDSKELPISDVKTQNSAEIEKGKKAPPVKVKKLTPDQLKAQKVFQQGMASVMDLIAPAAFNITPNYLELSGYFVRTLFVVTYPQYLQSNWLSPVINYDITLDISMFIHPLESQSVAGQLRKKAAQFESSLTIEEEKGMVRNPELETAIQNIEGLRDSLQKGDVRLFQFGLYFTVYAKTLEELNTVTKQLESTLGGMLIYTRQSLLQMEQGFNSSIPLHDDSLHVARNLDTGSLSTTFPFISMTLSSNDGILYGINLHNSSLILYDRFKLENANSVVFAKPGAGKSYAVKLEALRSLMLGADVIVIDPENEYKMLTEAVGGTYVNISLNSDVRINPFDLPEPVEGAEGEDTLRGAITMLHGLIGLMVGKLNPEEDSLLDKALYETYAMKDITIDPSTQKNPPPIMPDLQSVLANMTGAESLMQRLTKYTEGTFAGLFTKPTNLDLKSGFLTFTIRDLEDELRPIAMYMVLNHIWTQVKTKMKKRILIIDEAWLLMQYEDSARFVFSLAKRARKYYLGLTVISQEVDDFLDSKYGRAVVTSSSMQLLLKQQKIAAQKLSEVFGLTEGEKIWLMECEVGQGLFFAGSNHVAIEIVASYNEDQIITTNPQQLLQMKEMGQIGGDE